MVEAPTDLQLELVRRSNHAVLRAQEVEENWLSKGTHIVDGLQDGEVLVNKTFVEKIRKCAFAAYTDVRDLIK